MSRYTDNGVCSRRRVLRQAMRNSLPACRLLSYAVNLPKALTFNTRLRSDPSVVLYTAMTREIEDGLFAEQTQIHVTVRSH